LNIDDRPDEEEEEEELGSRTDFAEPKKRHFALRFAPVYLFLYQTRLNGHGSLLLTIPSQCHPSTPGS
jgi:hypothetical protein